MSVPEELWVYAFCSPGLTEAVIKKAGFSIEDIAKADERHSNGMVEGDYMDKPLFQRHLAEVPIGTQ